MNFTRKHSNVGAFFYKIIFFTKYFDLFNIGLWMIA